MYFLHIKRSGEEEDVVPPLTVFVVVAPSHPVLSGVDVLQGTSRQRQSKRSSAASRQVR